MTETRTCPKCGKELRTNNTRGVCTECWNAGERPTGSGPKPQRAKGESSVKRFRTVAPALGKNPDAILEEFAQKWLLEVIKAVEGKSA